MPKVKQHGAPLRPPAASAAHEQLGALSKVPVELVSDFILPEVMRQKDSLRGFARTCRAAANLCKTSAVHVLHRRAEHLSVAAKYSTILGGHPGLPPPPPFSEEQGREAEGFLTSLVKGHASRRSQRAVQLVTSGTIRDWSFGQERALKEALEIWPENAEAHLVLANKLFDWHRYAEAEASIRAHLALRPRAHEAWSLLGSVLQKSDQTQLAEGAYLEACTLQPDSSSAWTNLAAARLELKRPDEARPCLQRALALDADNREALQYMADDHAALGQLDAAATIYARLEDKSWPNVTTAKFGLVLFRQGVYSEALSRLRFAYGAGLPPQEAVRDYYGRCLFFVGNFWEACFPLEVALAHDEANVETRHYLGQARLAAGQLQGAEESFRRIIELEPTHAGAHYGLAAALHKQERWQEAETAYQQAFALGPCDATVFVERATVLSILSRDAEAERWSRAALAQMPNHPPALLQLGFALSYQGRHAEAEPHLRQILHQEPHHLQACQLLLHVLDAQKSRPLDGPGAAFGAAQAPNDAPIPAVVSTYPLGPPRT